MFQQTYIFFKKNLKAQHRKLLIFAFSLITQTSNEKYKLKKICTCWYWAELSKTENIVRIGVQHEELSMQIWPEMS